MQGTGLPAIIGSIRYRPRQWALASGPPALMNEDVSWLPSGGDLSLMVYSMEQIHLTPLPLPPPGQQFNFPHWILCGILTYLLN